MGLFTLPTDGTKESQLLAALSNINTLMKYVDMEDHDKPYYLLSFVKNQIEDALSILDFENNIKR